MEQNLSDRERKIRLGIGLMLLLVGGFSYLRMENIYLTAGLLLAASGFIANYFTCFCGTKKFLNEIRKRF